MWQNDVIGFYAKKPAAVNCRLLIKLLMVIGVVSVYKDIIGLLKPTVTVKWFYAYVR